MPGDNDRPRSAVSLSAGSQKFLETLLVQCRRANLPGGEHLIELIERTLAEARIKHDPRLPLDAPPPDARPSHPDIPPPPPPRQRQQPPQKNR